MGAWGHGEGNAYPIDRDEIGRDMIFLIDVVAGSVSSPPLLHTACPGACRYVRRWRGLFLLLFLSPARLPGRRGEGGEGDEGVRRQRVYVRTTLEDEQRFAVGNEYMGQAVTHT